jgi:hypothetical protein
MEKKGVKETKIAHKDPYYHGASFEKKLIYILSLRCLFEASFMCKPMR